MSIEQAVDRGAQMLYETVGPRWANGIDLETLDLGDSTLCVLGQLYGTYDKGVEELYGPNYWEDWKEGFNVGLLGCSADELTDEWRYRIDNLQKAYTGWDDIREEGSHLFTVSARFTVRIGLTKEEIGGLYIEAQRQNTTLEELLEDKIGQQASEAKYSLEA